jgi:hypothetical protein
MTSRAIVFDLNNYPVGAFTADINRGWVLLGNTGVSDGAQTTVTIPDEFMDAPWLQLGRMVLVERPPLPPWAGVIDTPWKATLPVEITLYNAEYLFALRAAERSVLINSSVGATISEMIHLANEQEPLYIQFGNSGNVQDIFEKTIEAANIWDQMIEFLTDAGYEMMLRPQRDTQGRLSLLVDIGLGLGVDTGFLLHDGDQGNMKVIDAVVDGKIVNRVRGISGETSEQEQLQTDILEDQASQDLYRTRSEWVQFRNVTQQTALNQYTQNYLTTSSVPYLDLTVDVLDVGDTFANLRSGNRLIVHASEVHLPGGRQGWRGTMRALAMAFDETSNSVKMKLRGFV